MNEDIWNAIIGHRDTMRQRKTRGAGLRKAVEKCHARICGTEKFGCIKLVMAAEESPVSLLPFHKDAYSASSGSKMGKVLWLYSSG
jgi:hypothetical protein